MPVIQKLPVLILSIVTFSKILKPEILVSVPGKFKNLCNFIRLQPYNIRLWGIKLFLLSGARGNSKLYFIFLIAEDTCKP